MAIPQQHDHADFDTFAAALKAAGPWSPRWLVYVYAWCECWQNGSLEWSIQADGRDYTVTVHKPDPAADNFLQAVLESKSCSLEDDRTDWSQTIHLPAEPDWTERLVEHCARLMLSDYAPYALD
ncbi:hypothetical protein [Kitasatospora sp. NPDC088783]|uniref:hypothetical protein n=1 Tax=Kitasatospora sp. NPDC088783 TaxID=3364077 RepID=UPI00382827F7